MLSPYVCPKTRTPLHLQEDGSGLVTENEVIYPCFSVEGRRDIPDFRSAHSLGDAEKHNLEIYDKPHSVERYGNELKWLYATFGENGDSFRKRIMAKLDLRPGNQVLITGCGLGSDIKPAAEAVGPEGKVFAQDLAPEMVFESVKCANQFDFPTDNIHFSISDAAHLPFPDNFFDAAFHFGGINLFDDIKSAISEMERVVKPGGTVEFGDESVAPWLRNSDYGRAAICNNSLWKVGVPLDLLPPKATEVELSWVLGNCFYLIKFKVSEDGPYMDMDIPHIGARGGSMRTRYFGQLEGVSEDSKKSVIEAAAKKKTSIHNWLEEAIQEKLSKDKKTGSSPS